MKAKLVTMLLCCATVMAQAQGKIEDVLTAIGQNNKGLRTKSALLDAEKLTLKTGNNLNDPALKYDYMAGSPTMAGNQTDVTFTQQFDFPSVYGSRAKAVDAFGKVGQSQLLMNRQQVLLDAKVVCLELIYRRKLKSHLAVQAEKYEKVLGIFEKNLSIGNGNAMDVNKAKVQLLENAGSLKENEAAMERLMMTLVQMNGGQMVAFDQSDYLSEASMVVVDQKNAVLENWGSDIAAYGDERISVAKKGALPKLEMGYHYQGVLDQSFHGGLIGLSIPLWSNRNKVNEARARKLYDEASFGEMEASLSAEQMEAKRTAVIASDMLKQYRKVMGDFENGKLLDKALSIGEITAVEYFLESNYYHNIGLKYLQFEFDLQRSTAILNRSSL